MAHRAMGGWRGRGTDDSRELRWVVRKTAFRRQAGRKVTRVDGKCLRGVRGQIAIVCILRGITVVRGTQDGTQRLGAGNTGGLALLTGLLRAPNTVVELGIADQQVPSLLRISLSSVEKRAI